MSRRYLVIRSVVRVVLAVGVIVLAGYALSRVAARAAEGAPLAMVSALLLVVVLVAVSHPKRSS